MSWSNHFSNISEVPSCILSSILWNNCSIRINSKPITFRLLSNQNLIYLHQLFDNNGRLKNWDNIKSELELNDSFYFQWRQLVHSIPQKRKLIIKENYHDNLLYSNHHLIKKNNVLSLDKLNVKELYSMLVYDAPHRPTSQKYFEQLFPSEIFIWKDTYLLVRKVTTDCYLRSFQYKILNNILFLNKELSVFGISNSSLCSFCNLYDETITHLYCH